MIAVLLTRNLHPWHPHPPTCTRRATTRMSRVVDLIEELKAQQPHLTNELNKILCHVAEV